MDETTGSSREYEEDEYGLALAKGDHRYVFVFRLSRLPELFKAIEGLIRNHELDFSHQDAAVLFGEVDKIIAEVKAEAEAKFFWEESKKPRFTGFSPDCGGDYEEDAWD
jgi:hypothetical protein